MTSASLQRFQRLGTNGSPLIDFGHQPVSNRFLDAKSGESAPRFPLALRIDSPTGLLHLQDPFPVAELCPRYPWLTCFEPEAHLDNLVERIISLPGVGRNSVFAAYSFKDDSTLERLRKSGYGRTWRLDPSSDLGMVDPNANVESYQQAFTVDRAASIREKKGATDVLIVRHVLEHANHLEAFLMACRTLVRTGGYIVFEVPDCTRALELGDYTTIWEEHVFYFTAWSLRCVLGEAGFTVQHFESWPYPFENSLIAIVSTGDVGGLLLDEKKVEEEIVRATQFATGFKTRREEIRNRLAEARAARGSMAIFGAGHLSVAFLSLFNLEDLIDFVVDDNPNKAGLRMPCGDLPILGSPELYRRGTRVCLLGLNPQNQGKVMEKHQRFVDEGGRFASIFPGTRPDIGALL